MAPFGYNVSRFAATEPLAFAVTAVEMKRVVIQAALVVIALSLFIRVDGPHVFAQNPISIEAPKATIEFPNQLIFKARIRSNAPLERVILEYGVDARTCGSVTARAFPLVEPTTFADVSWAWDMRQSGSEPPGAQIWYRWRIIDSAGNSFVSEDLQVTWIDPNHGWQEISSGLITLHWYRYPPEFAQELLDTALSALDRLSRDTGIVPQDPINLYIYANTEDMLNAVLYVPGWAGGLAYPEHNVVLIGITPEQIEWGKRTIVHEFTHVLIGQLTFSCLSSVPTWLNEGIAVYSEGDLDPLLATLLSNAIARNDLPPLRALGKGFSQHADRATFSYAQSYSVVNYLIANFGAERMLNLFTALRDGQRIDEALQAIYGFGIDELDNRWRAVRGMPALPAAVVAQAVADLPAPSATLPPVVAPPQSGPLTIETPTAAPATAVATLTTESLAGPAGGAGQPAPVASATDATPLSPFDLRLVGAAVTFLIGLVLLVLSVLKLVAAR